MAKKKQVDKAKLGFNGQVYGSLTRYDDGTTKAKIYRWHAFNRKLRSQLLAIGFKPVKKDPCTFWWKEEDN